MRFNPAKCNIMRVLRTRNPKLFHYSLTGQVLGEGMDAKYLGVTLSNNLEWSKHITTMTNNANSPDSIPTLVQCWFNVVHYNGPWPAYNLGPV